jgi:hypothetical protein
MKLADEEAVKVPLIARPVSERGKSMSHAPAGRLVVVMLLFIAILSAGCSDDGDSSPMDPPPPTAVTFSGDVQPIFNSRCTGCHGVAGNAGLNLTADDSYENLVGVQASGYDAILVVPGNPDSSVLYNKVADTGVYGATMPAAGTPLTSQQIETMRTWIEEGAEDN